MAKIPVKFKRVAAAFNEASRAMRPCSESSSGSEHYSPEENSADLSDLVNSFIERDYAVHDDGEDNNNDQQEVVGKEKETRTKNSDEGEEGESYNCSNYERKEMLESLLKECNNNDVDDFKQKIRAEVGLACRFMEERSSMSSSPSSPVFKRQLMAVLREKGFDAGLCKSRWEKFGRHSYNYIDVNHNGVRYVVEVFLAGEFQIARPTAHYASLLEQFPHVFVGKHEEMKQLVRLMCAAIRESMKSMDLRVPPWRRHGYTQAKWFGPYKRTTREFSGKSNSSKSDDNSAAAASAKSSIGFKALPMGSYRCGDSFARGAAGLRVGQLTAAINGKDIGMGL